MQFTQISVSEELFATVPDVWVDHFRKITNYPVGVSDETADKMIKSCDIPDVGNMEQQWHSYDCEIRYTCGA